MNLERLYKVLLGPHISEKSTLAGEASNSYTFKVVPDATKPEIKAAVEQIFEVRVESVNTMNVKGKVKRTMRGTSRRKNWKKAIVRLAEGQAIDFAPAE
ncbi:MAG: 50S ribosomal protein L23 [Pseudomonadales bacterium]|nr:50S ribosomal protein L23 [Pseudomonadales bacterium]MEE2891459.1 50S ribosomal protein L23 [Pseudomonadota bacterium]